MDFGTVPVAVIPAKAGIQYPSASVVMLGAYRLAQ
jgi:hypothetical protein